MFASWLCERLRESEEAAAGAAQFEFKLADAGRFKLSKLADAGRVRAYLCERQ